MGGGTWATVEESFLSCHPPPPPPAGLLTCVRAPAWLRTLSESCVGRSQPGFLACDVSIASVLSVSWTSVGDCRGLCSGMVAVPALPGPLPWGTYRPAGVESCVRLEAPLDLFNEPLANAWKDK